MNRSKALLLAVWCIVLVSAMAAMAAHDGVPELNPDYTADVEDWWAVHPFNPYSSNWDTAINSPSTIVTVGAGSIQTAINNAASGNVTIHVNPGSGGGWSIRDKDSIHIIAPSGGVSISGGCSIRRCTDTGDGNPGDTYTDPACYTDPVKDFYIKDLDFVGGATYAVYMGAARDIIFDGCSFSNYSQGGSTFHYGVTIANARCANVWKWDCDFSNIDLFFSGGYWDGMHGGGLLDCNIGSGSRGHFLFLANDDLSRDTNNDGLFSDYEMRNSRYCVMQNNTLEGGIAHGVICHGSEILLKNNVVNSALSDAFAQFNARCSQMWPALVYEHYDLDVIGNTSAGVNRFVHLNGPSGQLNCDAGNYGRLGHYEVRGNVMSSASSVVDEDAPVDGPNLVCGNVIGSGTPDANCDWTDSSNPSVPGNLHVSAIGSSLVTLAWDHATDDTGIRAYEIYDNGSLIATVEDHVYRDPYYNHAGLTPNSNHSYTIKAIDWVGNESALSSPLAVTTPATQSYSWTSMDIGAVGIAGSSTDNQGEITVNAAGSDIWNTADSFHFMYVPMSGNGEVVARCVSLSNSNVWTKPGVMIRETLTAGSAHACTVRTSSFGTRFFRRTSTNGTSSDTLGGGGDWLKITRSGDTFSSYRSWNGSDWTLIDTDTIPMATNVYAGIAVTRHDSSDLCTVVFDGVSAPGGTPGETEPPSAPGSLAITDTTDSAVAMSWSASTDNSGTVAGYRVYRDGSSIGTTGALTYTDNTVSCCTSYSYTVTAYDLSGNESDPSNMVSTTTPAGVQDADLDDDGAVDIVDLQTMAGQWLGTGCGVVGDLDGSEQVDLADFALLAADWGLTSSWNCAAVGGAMAGSCTDNGGGSFTVDGGGADIYGTSDAFQFMYQELTGDGEVIARVSSVENTHAWAKAGVMIRNTLDAGSYFALTYMTPDTYGVQFEWRNAANPSTGQSDAGISQTSPEWVRIVRSGDTFTSYHAEDNAGSPGTWSQIGSAQTISMNNTVYVGLAVCSHSAGTLCTAEFDSVQLVEN